MTSCSEVFPSFLYEAFFTPCLQVFFVFFFGASYREAHSGRASSPPGGAGKEEKECKAEDSDFPEGCPPAWGKILKVGVYSSPSSTIGAGDPLRRVAEAPLEVLPISVWSPMPQGVEPPPPMPDDVGRGRFGAAGNEDSLLSHVELAIGAVSSIIRDSNLKKVDALSVEEALALLL